MSTQRTEMFEVWQSAAAEALSLPTVRQQLGQLATHLDAINQQAFLLSVRDHEVRVPRQYRDTDRVGMLPRPADTGVLFAHTSLWQPTPGRLTIAKETLRQSGRLHDDAALERLIGRMAKESRDTMNELLNPPCVYSGAAEHDDTATGVYIASRPLEVIRWSVVPTNRMLMGAVAVHELMHIYDAMQRGQHSTYYTAAASEVRGYRAAAVVHQAAIKRGAATADEADDQDPLVAQVEELREQHGIDPAAVFADDFTLTAQHDNLIINMWLIGAAGY